MISIEKHTGIFATSGDVQTAVENGSLYKPYMAIVHTPSDYIDWNTQEPVPQENWVDLRTIDNNTPIYNIAWNSNFAFSTINDTWFSEQSGLTTDTYVDNPDGWRSNVSTTEAYGYYMYHRMSNNYRKYTCTFIPEGRAGYGANLGYGDSMVDANINQLPTITINGNTYYALNIVDWQNWKPLYMPLSTSKIQSTYNEGKILVDIAPKS